MSRSKVPSYSHHKASGQAYIYVNRKPVYLGKYGTPESRAEYGRMIAELAKIKPEPAAEQKPIRRSNEPTALATLIARYIAKLKADGELEYVIETAVRATHTLLDHYGEYAVEDFDTVAFEEWRDRVINSGSRQEHREGKKIGADWVNRQANAVKKMLKWGVVRKYFPAANLVDIQQIENVKPSNPKVEKVRKRETVSKEHFEKTLAVISPPVACILRLLLITGSRPDEITIMRPCDLRSEKGVLVYTVNQHKNQWRDGKPTMIVFGKRAQKELKPWLAACPSPEDYVFSPARYVGILPRVSNGKECYTDESLCRCVTRACERAGVAKWTPYQLRHTTATDTVDKHGLEAAQTQLRHKSIDTTLLYDHANLKRQIAVAKKIG